MKDLFQRILAISLCVQLTLLGTTFEGCVASRVVPAPGPSVFSSRVGPKETSPLRPLLQKPYVELFDLSPTLEFTASEIHSQRKALEKGEDLCITRFSRIMLGNTETNRSGPQRP